jgi:hypothetical protein
MSSLTKMISSPKTLASIKAVHKIVKAHVTYRRVWSDKRLTESGINTVYKHRIKYERCNPSDAQLDSLNKALSALGLIAKRYTALGHYFNRLSISSLVIQHI